MNPNFPPKPPMNDQFGSPESTVMPPQGGGNPIQAELMKRAQTITPQDVQELRTGITPQAAAIIKRLLPEIGALIDRLHAAPAGGGAPPQPQASAPGDMPPRPMSRLNQV